MGKKVLLFLVPAFMVLAIIRTVVFIVRALDDGFGRVALGFGLLLVHVLVLTAALTAWRNDADGTGQRV